MADWSVNSEILPLCARAGVDISNTAERTAQIPFMSIAPSKEKISAEQNIYRVLFIKSRVDST
jgi:hypothetical protein